MFNRDVLSRIEGSLESIALSLKRMERVRAAVDEYVRMHEGVSRRAALVALAGLHPDLFDEGE